MRGRNRREPGRRGEIGQVSRLSRLPGIRKMRQLGVIPGLLLCLFLVALSVACTPTGDGGTQSAPLLVPTELPLAATLPPMPTLPAPTEVAPVTDLPPAPELVPVTALPTLTELVPATALSTSTELPSPTAAPDPELPLVTIGAATWQVELAITGEQLARGLSGRELLPAGTGMLFIYQQEGNRTFWMPDLRFPLDMVWIGGNCEVADVTLNAPIPLPGQSRNDLPRFSPNAPAQYVLEINAGEFESQGINVGDSVRFGGSLSGAYGC